MNHIIQISLDMDTDNVQRIVEAQAAREIIKHIQDGVESGLFEHTGWSSDSTDPRKRSGFSGYVMGAFEKFLADNRDAIIEMAANVIAEKTIRSKAFKEAWKAKMEEARG